MNSTFPRPLCVAVVALAAVVLFVEAARADFGFPPPDSLGTAQGILRAIVVTLVVELAIVIYACRRYHWSLARFLMAGIVGNLVSLPGVWIVSTVGFFLLGPIGFAVFVLAELGAVACESVFYVWIGRQPFRSCLCLALVANAVTMGLGLIDHAVHFRGKSGPPKKWTVERTEYHDPPQQPEDVLTDDTLDEKNPVFDEHLVDSRPLGDWEVNASAAVIRLDCPPIKPDVEQSLLVLHRSYQDAIREAPRGRGVLPSANLLDGAAKQFDDGLYAAVDLACYRGDLSFSRAAPDVVESMFTELPVGSPGRPFLAAALELAGRAMPLEAEEERKKQSHLERFEADRARSKPIGFYQWTPDLEEVWRFYRLLQTEFGENQLDICQDVATVLQSESQLLTEYRAINAFYGRLSNPHIALSADALIEVDVDLQTLARRHGVRHPAVSIFPPSTSRETELFEQLFPMGVPPGTNLMTTLIRRIRSGEMDLEPRESDGWYQYQVYALETMLLPTRGQEAEKLQLTAGYKKRLVEAFKALMTKRRETHVRQLVVAESPMAAPLRTGEVQPRLRIEPCPTFYLRTARAYAFVENLLLSTVGREQLAKLRGLRQGGSRESNLGEELEATRLRFYGFYLVSCEDIGMKPQFAKDELIDQGVAKNVALQWLNDLEKNGDLACDTRVAVPIHVDARGTRLWATLGVRLTPLKAEYARPPKLRPLREKGPWQDAQADQLAPAEYLIPVDEFAEFALSGSNTLTREEFRSLCDRHKTKEEILTALTARQ
jgi:hypothetical protein